MKTRILSLALDKELSVYSKGLSPLNGAIVCSYLSFPDHKSLSGEYLENSVAEQSSAFRTSRELEIYLFKSDSLLIFFCIWGTKLKNCKYQASEVYLRNTSLSILFFLTQLKAKSRIPDGISSYNSIANLPVVFTILRLRSLSQSRI